MTGVQTCALPICSGDYVSAVNFQNVKAGQTVSDPDDQKNLNIQDVVHADTGMGLVLNTPNDVQKGLSAAVITDGSVYTWGNNDYGQMGNRIIGKGPLDISNNKPLPNYVDGYRLVLENEPDGVRNNRLVTVFSEDSKPITAKWAIHPVIYYFNVYNEMPVERNLLAKYIFTSTDEKIGRAHV